MVRLNVNGIDREVDAEPETPLLWVLREQLGLTGTKYGCGIAQCGACTVHIDGEATRSCSLPLSAFTADQKIVTIEGLSADRSHPVQKRLGGARRSAVRLLPVRPDHVRGGASRPQSEAERGRHRHGDVQHLSLRHVQSHQGGGEARLRNRLTGRQR